MEMNAFAVATGVISLNPNSYTGTLQDSWCIGTVPHGGYVASCILVATQLHFSTTLKHLQQPHTITQHLTFVRRTSIGPFSIHIKETKLGHRTSTIHVTLVQGTNRECVVGYVTQSDMSSESGITLPTKWSLFPPPAPAKLALLASDRDPSWQLRTYSPHPQFRKATSRVQCTFPRGGQAENSIVDEWMRFESGEKFTNQSLGFVVDMFPQIVEMYRTDAEGRASSVERELRSIGAVDLRNWGLMWYPTLLLNLDMKKVLPPEGVEWLFVRVRAKQIRDGRMDLEVVVLDEEEDLVAISNHVSLIVSVERNTAGRKEDVNVITKL